MEAAILKILKITKLKKLILLLKRKHTRTHFTHVVFVCYANNHFVELFKKKKKCFFY